MMFTLNELYLTRINGNVYMRCRAIKQSPIRRSGSTVVGNEKDDISHQSLNEPCEVTQSQRIKKANALLNPLENRLNRASRSVQKAFTLDKLVAAMTSYEEVVDKAELKTLDNLYDLLCNPCFLLIAYNSVKKDATDRKSVV